MSIDDLQSMAEFLFAMETVKKAFKRMQNLLSTSVDETMYYRDVNEALHFELQQKHEEIKYLKEKIERLKGAP